MLKFRNIFKCESRFKKLLILFILATLYNIYRFRARNTCAYTQFPLSFATLIKILLEQVFSYNRSVLLSKLQQINLAITTLVNKYLNM